MKGLNIRNFKKVHADEHHTVMRNDKGHELRINHHPLTPKMRTALSELPLHKAKENPRANYDDGGGVSPADIGIPPEEQAQASPVPSFLPPLQSTPGAPEEVSPTAGEAEHQRLADFYSKEAPGGGGGLAGGPESRAESAEKELDTLRSTPDGSRSAMQASRLKELEGIAQPPSSVGPEEQVDLNTMQAPAGEQPQEAAAPAESQQQQAPAPQAAAPAPSPRPAGLHPNIANPNATPQERAKDTGDILSKEDAAYKQDLANGHITPETYGSLFAKKDTLGKIGSLFGLMLGGLGSGLAGGPNLYLEQMNKLIDRDMDAAKQSKTNAYNMLRLNQDKVFQKGQIARMEAAGTLDRASAKNLNAEADVRADALTRLQKNDSALGALAEQSKTMPEGPEKQKFLQGLALVNSEVQKMAGSIIDKATVSSALMSLKGGSSGNESAFQDQQYVLRQAGKKDLADDNEAKHVAGFDGKASQDLSPKEREEIERMSRFERQVSRAQEFAKKHHDVRSWGFDTKAEGRKISTDLGSAFREANLNTVWRPSEQPLINAIVPDQAAKFFGQWTVSPKLKALQSTTRGQMSDSAKSKGLGNYVGYGDEPATAAPKQSGEIRQKQPDGSYVVYDAATKKPLRRE